MRAVCSLTQSLDNGAVATIAGRDGVEEWCVETETAEVRG